MSLLDGFLSLGRGINRAKGEFADEAREGEVTEPMGELALSMEDKDLLELSKVWKDRWDQSEARKDLDRKQKENEKYWLGEHQTLAQRRSGQRPLVDNLIFESLETFLPVATRQNPEPSVSTDETPEHGQIAKMVSDRLVDIADTLRLRLKVRKATRHWAIYYLGCMKLGWSAKKNEIDMRVIRPQLLILDPDAITDECEYEGDYIGEYRTDTASDLIDRFPAKADYIKKKANNKLGTKLRYIEWWTEDYLFWELDQEVLGKSKNPHWNYETTRESVDEMGVATTEDVPEDEINFFSNRKIPYAFLSVFNLGKSPSDVTNLIEQSLPVQDVINKRVRQIDKNADNMNAGAVVSGDAFTKEQAKQVGDALRKGQTVWVPRGNVNSVYKRDGGVPLPEFVYQSLVDARNALRDLFGTQGLSSPGIKSESTVRGKILVRAADTDRATVVVDHLEQFSDYIFNWIVQLMFVYYDEPHRVSRSQGTDKIVNTELFGVPLIVSVKEGSLIPKDRLSQRNEAVDLWEAKAIDPITLFERLEFPDPYETAKALYLWQNNPGQLFPDVPQVPVLPEPGAGGIPPPVVPPPESTSLLGEVPIS